LKEAEQVHDASLVFDRSLAVIMAGGARESSRMRDGRRVANDVADLMALARIQRRSGRT
jgi:hypothetical protein